MTNAAVPVDEIAAKTRGAIFHDDPTPPFSPGLGEDEYARTTRVPPARRRPHYIQRGVAISPR